MKKKLSRLGMVAAVILMAPFLFYALLQSAAGRAWISRSLSSALSRSENIEVKIGKIRGNVPFDMQVESVEILDAEGTWLKAEGLECRWLMRALFSGRVHVEQLGAERIDLIRLPEKRTGAKPPKFKGFKPLDVDLAGLDIKELRLGAAVARIPLRYAVNSGGLRMRSTGECSASLSVSGDALGRIDVEVPAFGSEEYLFKVAAEMEELNKPDPGLPGLSGVSGAAVATVSTAGAQILLEASAGDYKLGMLARLAQRNHQWGIEFESLDVQWMDRVDVEVSGDLWPDSVELYGTLSEVDLATLPITGISNCTGRLGGRLALTGSLAVPEVEVSLDATGLSTLEMSLNELPLLNLHVDASISNGLLHGEMHDIDAVSGTLQASADVPCMLSLQPFLFELSPTACRASADAALNLEILNDLSALKDHAVEGNLGVNLLFDGQSPEKLKGQVALENGSYEYAGVALPGLSGRADVSASDSGGVITLSASADDAEVGMHACVAKSNGLWGVDLRELSVLWLDGVDFELAGSIRPDVLKLEGAIAEFDVGKLPIAGISNFTGRLSSRIALSGSPAVPEIEASLDAFDLTTAQMARDELPNLNIHLAASQQNGQLHGEGIITNLVTAKMQASADVPCTFSLQPFLFELDAEACRADLQADLDLAVLNGIAALNDQSIRGNVTVDLALNGPSGKKFDGLVSLSDGFYEHYARGIVVRDIQADGVAADGGVLIREMTATDGNSGRITMGGSIGIWQKGIPLDLQVEIQKAQLVRREEVDSTLSANLHVGSLLAKPSLEGTLVVDRADILLDNIALPAPGVLTDFDASVVTNDVVADEVKKELPLSVDVTVLMPDQIFVNSFALDSVWGGELRLKSGADGMTVAGMVSPRRGVVEFIGKKFRISNEGGIMLDAAHPASSAINIKAEYVSSDIIAELGLVGKLNNPRYTLSSTPAMPEDEILSYILFGRDTSSVSPYQAYQIALAARQLAGGRSGVDFMYKLRKALRVDTLEWNEAETEDGKSSLAAGKYVGTGLYLEINSTFENEEGSTGVTAEYEFTPHFSVETSTGPELRPGIGINWKNDY